MLKTVSLIFTNGSDLMLVQGDSSLSDLSRGGRALSLYTLSYLLSLFWTEHRSLHRVFTIRLSSTVNGSRCLEQYKSDTDRQGTLGTNEVDKT